MIVQKMRLEQGWSQQQLADISGVNVRTIQRIEGGHPVSVETVKALAAAFHMDFNQLREAIMQGSIGTQEELEVDKALEYARDLRRFYGHVGRYLVISVFLVAVNLFQSPHHLWFPFALAGLTIALLFRWFRMFELEQWFGPEWEKKIVERRLGRTLPQPNQPNRPARDDEPTA